MIRIPTAAAITLALAACSTGTAPVPPRDTAAMEAEMTLEQRIERRLVEVFGPGADIVRVSVDRRRAILLGDVAERAVQELSKEVALSFDEVDAVTNRLRLIRPSDGPAREVARTVGEETADAALESEVKLTLAAEIGRHAGGVEVEVVEGVASLRGPVPDEARRTIALDTARGVAGIRQVIDLLRIVP